MGAGTALLEFAARARVEELPPPAVEVARLALLDWWGVTVAGATEPVSRRLGAVVREGTGPVSVLGTTRRASPVTAALLNGTAAHALDYDDTHLDLPGHLTAPIVPGLLALAESRHLGGRPLLAAFAVGAEVMCRLGRAFGRDHYRLGWHATTTLGRLGGAIAAGRLAGLDARLLDQAFGLAAAQLGGIQESFGTMAKPFQVGRAASDALLAALLAEAGVTGGSGLLGRDDWTRRLSSAWAPAALEDGLGHRWHFTEVLFKRYPCCFATHAAIRALLSFQPAPDPAAIQAVDLEICPTTLQVANQVAPRTGLGGKFSITHCAAVALRRGWVAEADFTDEAVADRGLRALAGRVRLHATSALDETRARRCPPRRRRRPRVVGRPPGWRRADRASPGPGPEAPRPAGSAPRPGARDGDRGRARADRRVERRRRAGSPVRASTPPASRGGRRTAPVRPFPGREPDPRRSDPGRDQGRRARHSNRALRARP